MPRLEDMPSYRSDPHPLLKVADGDGFWGKWRGVQAWELTIEWPAAALLVAYALLTGNKFIVQSLVDLNAIITIYIGARCAVIGVHVWKGSQERQLAMREQHNEDLNDEGEDDTPRHNNRSD